MVCRYKKRGRTYDRVCKMPYLLKTVEAIILHVIQIVVKQDHEGVDDFEEHFN